MKVVFRTDSSFDIGSGHVMRCLNFANYLNNKNIDVEFVCRDLNGNISSFISNYKTHLLAEDRNFIKQENLKLFHANWLETSQENDAKQTIEVLKNDNIDWLIIDHYALDEVWQKQVREALNCKIMVIDDLADRKHEADILLDQNYYIDRSNIYKNLLMDGCHRFIGPEYSLLKSEFFDVSGNQEPNLEFPNNLFIFFGSMDKTSETLKTLAALDDVEYSFKNVNVVCGSKNKDISSIKDICLEKGYDLHIDTNKMHQLMSQADCAIGAGGVSTWERCFTWLPSLVVTIAENQEEIARNCDEAGFIKYVGKSQDVSVSALSNAINEFITNKEQRENIVNKLQGYFRSRKLDEVLEIL